MSIMNRKKNFDKKQFKKDASNLLDQFNVFGIGKKDTQELDTDA